MSNRHAQPAALGPWTVHRLPRGAGILTSSPSPTALALGLGPTNPPRTNLPEETLGFRWTDFSSIFTLLMPAFALLAAPGPVTRTPSLLTRTLPYPFIRLRRMTATASADGFLAPVHCRRHRTRPVSYYALFKGWLLLSQPPGCLGTTTSFNT
jgi:hypothetical protein